MNLFEDAEKIQDSAAKIVKGSGTPLRTTVTMPHFKGNYRKDKGTDSLLAPVTGAFIINYSACLACQLVCLENQDIDSQNKLIKAENKKDPELKKPLLSRKVLTIYLVAALLQKGGFTEEDYARKHKPYKEISASLKAFAKKEKLAITINSESGEIKGIEKYFKDVLEAF